MPQRKITPNISTGRIDIDMERYPDWYQSQPNVITAKRDLPMLVRLPAASDILVTGALESPLESPDGIDQKSNAVHRLLVDRWATIPRLPSLTDTDPTVVHHGFDGNWMTFPRLPGSTSVDCWRTTFIWNGILYVVLPRPKYLIYSLDISANKWREAPSSMSIPSLKRHAATAVTWQVSPTDPTPRLYLFGGELPSLTRTRKVEAWDGKKWSILVDAETPIEIWRSVSFTLPCGIVVMPRSVENKSILFNGSKWLSLDWLSPSTMFDGIYRWYDTVWVVAPEQMWHRRIDINTGQALTPWTHIEIPCRVGASSIVI
jgi:hypothetical protein